MGRSVEPVVEEPLRLGDAARPEHGPQVLFELPCPEQARPGRLQVVELGPLALRQALPALLQREARPLDGPRRLWESGGVSSPADGHPGRRRLGVAALAALLATCHSSRHTPSRASFIRLTTWKGSMTHSALGHHRLTSIYIHL